MPYTDQERRLLSLYFSSVEPQPHADVYLVRHLPPEVAATLNGVYSRSQLSMRDNFLERLKKGLADSGRTLDDLQVPDAMPDVLSSVLADKSGKFLKTYAIDHGHNSLREGSVLHLAVENVSQLVTRFIQRERRCSFEESSTRYISFSNEGHWRDPDVMQDADAASAYEQVIATTFSLYQQLTEQLVAHLQEARPRQPDEQQGPYLRALRAQAFDAARYLLTPALHTKWGMVADARTLSEIVTELQSHPLAEFRLVGERLKQQGDVAVPTLLQHARPNAFLAAQHELLPALVERLPVAKSPGAMRPQVDLLAWDRDLDVRLLASLLYEHAGRPYAELQAGVAAMPAHEREALLREVLDRRGPRDALPAALEGAMPFEFEVLVDFGAYRDIGRHRKGFQQQQVLTTSLGYLVPDLIAAAGMQDRYAQTLDRAAELQQRVAQRHPLAAGYVTPFAFLQRCRLIFDPRQVAYFVELRSAVEGHFAYRQVALEMLDAVERVAPLYASLIRADRRRDLMVGRMAAEQGADERRRRRMQQAGDAE